MRDHCSAVYVSHTAENVSMLPRDKMHILFVFPLNCVITWTIHVQRIQVNHSLATYIFIALAKDLLLSENQNPLADPFKFLATSCIKPHKAGFPPKTPVL
jgi:hypothetical protein